MSFDSELYTRDRPIVDETQTSWLTRDGAYTWEHKKWLFGGMIVTVEPYAAGRGRLGDAFADADEVPNWAGELRWVVQVSGNHPDDDFFDWFSSLAADARGVICSPLRRRPARARRRVQPALRRHADAGRHPADPLRPRRSHPLPDPPRPRPRGRGRGRPGP